MRSQLVEGGLWLSPDHPRARAWRGGAWQQAGVARGCCTGLPSVDLAALRHSPLLPDRPPDRTAAAPADIAGLYLIASEGEQLCERDCQAASTPTGGKTPGRSGAMHEPTLHTVQHAHPSPGSARRPDGPRPWPRAAPFTGPRRVRLRVGWSAECSEPRPSSREQRSRRASTHAQRLRHAPSTAPK